MADLSDVEAALLAAVATIVYPNGAIAPSTLLAAVQIFRGLPGSALLSRDLASPGVAISIFPVPDKTRNTTRWGVQTFVGQPTPGLTGFALGNTATFNGSALSGDLAGVLVDQTPYVYAAQPNDAGTLAAAALADLIRQTRICWLSGATLTIPGAISVVARTAAPSPTVEEWARQEQEFRISVWTSSPALRDAACSLIGAGLSTISFLTLADGTGGRLRFHSTKSVDDDQASSVYRRDMTYTIEYGTTLATSSSTVLFGDLVLNEREIYT